MGLFGFGKKEKDKMKDGLEKTRTGFWGNILNTLTGSKIDDDLYDELEEQLILADVGGDVAMKLVDALRDRVQEKDPAIWIQIKQSAPFLRYSNGQNYYYSCMVFSFLYIKVECFHKI